MSLKCACQPIKLICTLNSYPTSECFTDQQYTVRQAVELLSKKKKGWFATSEREKLWRRIEECKITKIMHTNVKKSNVRESKIKVLQ
mgnify:CR=1 FL=1